MIDIFFCEIVFVIYIFVVGLDLVVVLRWFIIKILVKSVFVFIVVGRSYRSNGGMLLSLIIFVYYFI